LVAVLLNDRLIVLSLAKTLTIPISRPAKNLGRLNQGFTLQAEQA